MKTISRYIMTLALLLTAVTGAWAQDPNAVTAAEINSDVYSGWTSIDDELFKASELPGFQAVTENQAKSWTGVPSTGNVILYYEFVADGNVKAVKFENGVYVSSYEENDFERYYIYEDIAYNGDKKYFYTTGPAPAEPAITVKWDAKAKTGSFVMPAFDVEIAPIYAPVAQWAVVENVQQLPTAIEGIYAESTDAIVKAGTVAKIGGTENPQGTLMYAVGKSDTEQPALDAFSADVPTAKDITTAGDVYVWYYIKGADTPQGQDPTAENTFNDSEICAEPLTVTVLNNKFDIQFKAANANTIEAGKATVTVGGTDKTVTEGKLEGVKMGSEVKIKAKEGYKFRKVEVKKKGAGPLAAAFEDGAKIKVGYQWNSGNTTYLEFTNSGGTYSLTSVTGDNESNGFNSSTLTVKDSNVLALDVVCKPFGSKEDDFSAQIEFDATSSTYKYSSKGSDFTGIISVSVNDTDITSQLSELK